MCVEVRKVKGSKICRTVKSDQLMHGHTRFGDTRRITEVRLEPVLPYMGWLYTAIMELFEVRLAEVESALQYMTR